MAVRTGREIQTARGHAPVTEHDGTHRLWGGRFASGPAPSLEELNRSLPIDGRLWSEDIEASRAWVQALCRAGVLDPVEAAQLDRGLRNVHGRLAGGIPAGATDEHPVPDTSDERHGRR